MKNNRKLHTLLIPLICVLLIIIAKLGIEYYPLSFSIVFAFFNHDRGKFGIILNSLLIILASYVAFFSGYFSILFLSMITNNVYGVIFSISIVAPLILFLLYNRIFNFNKTKFTIYIIILSILFLLTINFLFYNFVDKVFVQRLKSMQLDNYALWQMIIAMAVQLILNQKSETVTFKNNTE